MSLGHAPAAVVVDASAMVEVLKGDPVWQARLAAWQAERALILTPPHFRLETANALLRSVRLEATEVIHRVQLLFGAGVQVADRGLAGTLDAIELAARHGLTVYDAAYLALALDVDAELATIDHALANAARAEGLAVIA